MLIARRITRYLNLAELMEAMVVRINGVFVPQECFRDPDLMSDEQIAIPKRSF
jgi:hypothetical protein